MPDPIQLICSRTPGAAYDPRDHTCRWISELGTDVSISRNQDGVITVSAIGQPAANESAPASPSSTSSGLGNVGISGSAMSRLNDISALLINHHDGLSPEMIERLNNEQKYLLQAFNLGCDIRAALKLLSKDNNLDIEALSATVKSISDDLNVQSVSALTPEAQAALCLILNDPNVEPPVITDELWDLICE